MTERDIEQDIIQKIRNAFDEHTDFSISENVLWQDAEKFYSFDLVIYRESMPYAVVEIISNIIVSHLKEYRAQINRACRLLDCRYGIVATETEYLLVDNKTSEALPGTFEEIFEILTSHSVGRHDEKGFLPHIAATMNNYNQGELSKFSSHVYYNEDSSKYSFDSCETENDFFRTLINKRKQTLFYRYMSLNSAFCTLRNLKYRMNSIVGMNDKSEIHFYDQTVLSKGKQLGEVSERIFLSSFSVLGDRDLTMWRLYGDDGKGVCLAFKVKGDFNDGIFNGVYYAKKTRDSVIHLLRSLIQYGFKFYNIDKWKHFFKPAEYEKEEEFRVVFSLPEYDLSNKDIGGWNITDSSKIISPYILLDMTSPDFPLKLEKVILGPKCPESELNKRLIKKLLEKTPFSDVEITSSNIKTYR